MLSAARQPSRLQLDHLFPEDMHMNFRRVVNHSQYVLPLLNCLHLSHIVHGRSQAREENLCQPLGRRPLSVLQHLDTLP